MPGLSQLPVLRRTLLVGGRRLLISGVASQPEHRIMRHHRSPRPSPCRSRSPRRAGYTKMFTIRAGWIGGHASSESRAVACEPGDPASKALAATTAPCDPWHRPRGSARATGRGRGGNRKVAGRNPAFFREVRFNRLRVRSDLPHGARWPKRSAHLVPAANRTGTQRSFCRDVP